MWDPSVSGRWEKTPTIVPVLDRIDIVESDSDDYVDATPILPEDLIPQPLDYRMQPGDVLEVSVLDYPRQGANGLYQVIVDARGTVTIPLLPGQIAVAGLTEPEAAQRIRDAIIEAGILNDPELNVTVPGKRQATFGVFGVVPSVGRYGIPAPDYRLLDALTDAGGVSPIIPKIYIIRQVSLTADGSAIEAPLPTAPAPDPAASVPPVPPAGPDDGGKSVLDLIDEIGGGDTAQPGALSTNNLKNRPSIGAFQPEDQSGGANGGEPQMIDLDGAIGDRPAGEPGATDVLIDLEDSGANAVRPIRDPLPGASIDSPEMRWVFRDGAWQRVTTVASNAGLPEGDDPLANTLPVVTQRVIEVPTRPLLNGVAEYNIVIRPGDVISVPSPPTGVVYLGGPGINRPGSFNLTGNTQLTIQRAVATAGNMSAIGVPERVDLVRMLGPDRQAIIRLDYRAIAAGTSPDIVLKPDDYLNFGTSFWATPLAVLRGGFRTSYGFGFLLDRNFGNDVFGAPPTNRVN